MNRRQFLLFSAAALSAVRGAAATAAALTMPTLRHVLNLSVIPI
ncbi:hypothetical protein [Klebsiella variicola]|nr:hypothetical protein [Klebsiella variicola]